MIDFENKTLFKLKRDSSYGDKVKDLLVDDEEVVESYKTMRDGVVFTSKRIVAVNVQGMTGKKKDFTSIPYSKIQAYSVETSGTFDLDAELEVYISSVGRVRFEFVGDSKVLGISNVISRAIL